MKILLWRKIENLQSYCDNLARLQKQKDESIDNDLIQKFLDCFQKSTELQNKLLLYQNLFSIAFPIKILLRDVKNKYPNYISYFRDIIPNDNFNIEQEHFFEFSDEQMSYLYFLWKSNANLFYNNYSFLTKIKTPMSKLFEYVNSFQQFSSKVKTISYNSNQKYDLLKMNKTDTILEFIKVARKSLSEKAMILFQFLSWESLYKKIYPIISQLYSIQDIYFFQYIYCTCDTCLISYLNRKGDFPSLFLIGPEHLNSEQEVLDKL